MPSDTRPAFSRPAISRPAISRPAFSGPAFSRRRFLGSTASVGAALGVAPLLGACGGDAASSDASVDQSETDKSLVVSNWALYIDTDRKGPDPFPTVARFEDETGIDVTYNEDITANTEFFAKIRPQLVKGSGVGRDLMVLTDWMAARLIRLGFVNEIDKSAIPNAKNLIPSLASPSFDPERKYSMPWQSGFTSIAYNSNEVDQPVTSITEMLTRPDLAGRVAVFTEMRDTVGLVMLDQGADPSDFTDEEFDAAIALLQDATDSGHIRTFADANYGQNLSKGNFAASMTYSGDINQLRADNPNLELVIPDSGFILWSDNMLIPVGALHQSNAEEWMNFYYRPDVAADVAAWVNFITPVKGAKEELAKVDPGLANNELIFPSEEFLEQGSIFMALDEDTEMRYQAAFDGVRGL
ncbi:MAG TPA: spermidine/putrescine ABC transporter substrate-binding protein [Actinomycetes bacterium]|nr:spermidine/putrescine ABC transporter substrate-binding protein [Actinomycetes bacterium]